MATWAQGEAVSVELPAGERWKPEHLDMSMGSMHISQDSFHETPREHAVPLADIKVFRPKVFAEDDEQALRDRADACGKRAADARVDAEAESEDRDAARLHRRRARVAAHDALECEAEAQASRRISVQSALMLERAKQAVEATRRHCTPSRAVCDAAAAEARAKLLDDRDAAAAAAPPAAPPPAPPTLAAARLEKTLKELKALAAREARPRGARRLAHRRAPRGARRPRVRGRRARDAGGRALAPGGRARAGRGARRERAAQGLPRGGRRRRGVRAVGPLGSEPPAADPGLQYKLEAAREEIAILKQRAEDARAEAEGDKRQHRQAEASAQASK
ncbi:hypothetical protein JL722_8955 [Aureococcus anophagefferens]|nr:hypothetical protein JL722_8955 [Aureococcus anophagefferens]